MNRLAADVGYFSKENVERAEKQHVSTFIAVKRDKHNQNWQERIAETAPAPDHPTPVEAMRWKLQTPEGKAFYARRKYTVEPVFGVIKQCIGFRQFLMRGKKRFPVKGIWCNVVYNLKKMYALSR